MEVSDVVLNAYQQAKKVQQNAYAPYSKFKVGSALKIKNPGNQGFSYVGVNPTLPSC